MPDVNGPLLFFGCALMLASSVCWFIGSKLYADATRIWTISPRRAFRLQGTAGRLYAIALALTVAGGAAMLVALT